MSIELTIPAMKTFIADYVNNLKIAQSTYTITNDPITGLTDKIGAQFTIPTTFTNPLSSMDYGELPTGVDIEEWHDELLMPESFSDHGGTYTSAMTEDELKPRYPLIDKCYSKAQEPFKFAKTFSLTNIKRAFISREALAEFETNFMVGLETAKQIALYEQDKKLIANACAMLKSSTNADYAYHFSTVTPTTEATAKNFIKSVKDAILKLSRPSGKYTIAGHVSATDKLNLVLALNMSILPSLQVDGRSNAYNLSELEFGVPVVPVEDFGDENSTILGVLYSPLGIRDYLTNIGTFETNVGSAAFKTYFSHGQHTLLISKFSGMHVWDTAAKPA